MTHAHPLLFPFGDDRLQSEPLDRVWCISAGLLRPKKVDHPLARLHRYLNYGLLGIASALADRGLRVCVSHGHFSSPDSFVERKLDGVDDSVPSVVLLSLPSTQSVPWAYHFLSCLKRRLPGVTVIAGGRWVIGTDATWIRSRLPQVDLFVYGTAESRALDLLSPSGWHAIHNTERTCSIGRFAERSDKPPMLDYSLLDDAADFHPSLEVSRGCGLGCQFCLERNTAITTLRDVSPIVDQLIHAKAVWPEHPITPYFEASMFLPNRKWVSQLSCELDRAALRVEWRCETRVDALNPDLVPFLASCGLKVIDVGLESGSPTQLKRMGKSSRPWQYLRKASNLVTACAACGIRVKVNILLYAGETEATLAETREFLATIRRYIVGVSVNPLLIYRSDPSHVTYLSRLQELGCRLVDADEFERTGVGELHLSEAVDSARAAELSLEVAREVMSAKDYFELKSFSYFSPRLSRASFDALVAEANPDDLPFSIQAHTSPDG